MSRYLSPLAKIRRAVCERAEGSCEACGCHVGFAGELGHLDHFFGRKHAESIESCWLLCPEDHQVKSLNQPSATWWLKCFILHAERHGYDAVKWWAESKLAVLAQKFPEAVR